MSHMCQQCESTLLELKTDARLLDTSIFFFVDIFRISLILGSPEETCEWALPIPWVLSSTYLTQQHSSPRLIGITGVSYSSQ